MNKKQKWKGCYKNPLVYDNEGLDPLKVQQGMKKEAQSMKTQGVFTEMNYNVPEEHKNKIIESKWVNKPKQDEVRCRIVAKGFLETIQDLDNIYASTPIFGILRILLTMAQHNHWTIQAGDVSTAFLHAPAATDNLYMWPPPELPKWSQHNHSVEAQQSNLWTTIKSKIVARPLCTSPATNGTDSTDK